jgi:hypothetical protein
MTIHHGALINLTALAFALATLCGTSAALAARRSVDEHQAAEPQGKVEIINVSGRIEVVGWDKPEVEATGSLGTNVEKVDISSVGSLTTIRVVLGDSGARQWGISQSGPDDAELVVHVPRGSSLSASLVSSDISVREIQGAEQLQTVSGEVDAAATREAHVNTISGGVRVSAGPESQLLEIGSVSGDLQVTGGGGDVSVTTVSGEGTLSLGAVNHVRLKSVSGQYKVLTGLAADGYVEAESVSGDFDIKFVGGAPPAAFDLQSFSGDLKICFGPKAVREKYGPGSRLSYREGAASARVRIDTNSGDVSICAQHL